MNRDEERDRPAALSPTVVKIESRRAVFPYEPTGGTWIAVNDGGVCLALINWYRVQRKPSNGTLSRGLVVRELAGENSANKIATSLKKLPLRKLRAFRLIAILPGEGRVIEWRWNVKRLTKCEHHWQRQHWFSSGFDEPRAEFKRAKTCASWGTSTNSLSLKRLRNLHRSHAPKRGPFSICMHRADAVTVSYTEVSVTRNSAAMRYVNGTPCKARFVATKKLPVA